MIDYNFSELFLQCKWMRKLAAVDLYSLLVYLHPAAGWNAILAIAVVQLEEVNLLLPGGTGRLDQGSSPKINVDVAGVIHTTDHNFRLQGR